MPSLPAHESQQPGFVVRVYGETHAGIEFNGTGFILSSSAHVATCAHVVSQARTIHVQLPYPYDGPAEFVVRAESAADDLAVLASSVPLEQPRDWARLDRDWTLTTHPGNAVDIWGFSTREYYAAPQHVPSTVRQFDARNGRIGLSAAINPGDSGAPVINDDGFVIGIVNANDRSREGHAQAVPVGRLAALVATIGEFPARDVDDVSLSDDVASFLDEVENRDDLKYVTPFHLSRRVPIDAQYVPIELTVERRYRHAVETSWAYSESDDGIRAYADESEEDASRERASWEKVRRDHNRLVVLADPGMGKSTLLAMEARVTARDEREALQSGRKTIDDVCLPVYLRFAELGGSRELIEEVPELVRRDHPRHGRRFWKLLRAKLEAGKVLVLLDALDEVARDERHALSGRLERLARHYPCPIVCTSRLVGYGAGAFAGMTEVEIMPLGEDQQQALIKLSFADVAAADERKRRVEGLLRALRSKPQVRSLTRNPLMLSMVCSLYHDKARLPAGRSQVYAQALGLMLGEWSARRGAAHEDRVLTKLRVLEFVAYRFSTQGAEMFSIEALREAIEQFLTGNRVLTTPDRQEAAALIVELTEHDGIIRSIDRQSALDAPRYIFLHRTFQEYLTAAYLLRSMKSRSGDGLDAVREHLWDFDWQETLVLLAGMMKESRGLVSLIVDERDDMFSSMLILAARCLAERPEPGAKKTKRVVNRLFKLWKRHHDAAFVQSAAMALAQSNARFAAKVADEFLRDKKSKRAQRPESSEKGWKRIANAAEVLATAGTDAAMDSLLEGLRHRVSTVRRYAVWAIGECGDDERGLPALLQCLQSDDRFLRQRVVSALGKIGSDRAIQGLALALADDHRRVSRDAATALERIGDHRVVEAMAIVARDPRQPGRARRRAIHRLERLAGGEAETVLLEVYRQGDEETHFTVVGALSAVGTSASVPALIEALDDLGNLVRDEAIDGLGRLGDDRAIGPLLRLLHDPERSDRKAALALGRMGTESALDGLIEAYPQIGETVKAAVLDALAEHSAAPVRRDERVLTFLASCAADASSAHRVGAILALRKAGGDVSSEVLRFAFDHGDDSERTDALEALVADGHGDALDLCRRALIDEDPRLREGAVEGLVTIASEEALEALFSGLNPNDASATQAAEEALDAHPELLTPEVLLPQATKDKPQPFVVELLGRVEGDMAFDLLQRFLLDSSEEIQQAAVNALAKSHDERAPDVLAWFISPPDPESEPAAPLTPETARTAVRALAERRDERVIPLLVDHLYAVDADNRERVIRQLEQIGTPAVLEALLGHPRSKKLRRASDIFAFARRLALRLRREGSLDGPVYSEKIDSRRRKRNRSRERLNG